MSSRISREEPWNRPGIFYRSGVGSLSGHRWDESQKEQGTFAGRPTLGFLHHGVGEIQVGARRISSDPSQVLLLRGRSFFTLRHRRCTGPPCAITVTLSRNALRSLRSFSRSEMARVRELFSNQLARRGPEIQKKAQLLFLASKAAHGETRRDVDDRILDLFREVVRRTRSSKVAKTPWRREVQHIRLVLSSRLETPPGLEELATGVGCSRYHLCRIFKQETGLTIRQYLHRLRLHEAVLRMAEGEAEDLSGLAFELGYASHSHFTGRFRRYYGVTPSTFREQLHSVGEPARGVEKTGTLSSRARTSHGRFPIHSPRPPVVAR